MEAIGQLTGGVAHDFNNLLAAVLGGIHVLERRLTLGEREQLIVDQMRHAAEHGAELVRRMMAFARKQDLSPVSVDPSSLCQSVAGLVEHTLGGTVSIDWQCPTTASNLFVDKSQLELALLNLILNARDAMPDGGEVTVAIDEIGEQRRARRTDRCRRAAIVRIRVTDQGSGIAESEIEKITEPFYTTKEAGKGTGLGLSMVLGFVQQSGGRLLDHEQGRQRDDDRHDPALDPAAGRAKAAKRGAGARADDGAIDPAGRRRRCGAHRGRRAIARTWLRRRRHRRRRQRDQRDRRGRRVRPAAERFRHARASTACRRSTASATMRPDIRSALMTGYADDSLTAIDREAITVFRKPIDIDELLGFLAS